MATGLTGAEVHSGSWFGLPDFGITEWLQGQKTTSPSPTGLVNSDGTPAQTPQTTNLPALVLGSSTGSDSGSQSSGDSGGGSGGGGVQDSRIAQLEKTDRNPKEEEEYQRLIRESSQGQQEAAAKAAEARRQAALRAYQGKVAAAQTAKSSAKGQYDWITETLGSNKQDLLDQVALNEKTGIEGYEKNQADTQKNYDDARKEILTTYRDLQREQERILRGTGVASSSRAQEATLRLNNLMGKDLSEVSTNEADALAQIGNALSAFKSQIVLTKNSIETETKSKLDKAALDYDDQIKAIDVNLQLSANEREDAYASAEAQLAQDTANINSWAAGLMLQAEQTIAKNTDTLTNFVADMTDSNGALNKSLEEKQAMTVDIISALQSGGLTLDQEAGLTNPTVGVKKVVDAKTLADLYTPEGTSGLSGTGVSATGITEEAKKDPLLATILA